MCPGPRETSGVPKGFRVFSFPFFSGKKSAPLGGVFSGGHEHRKGVKDSCMLGAHAGSAYLWYDSFEQLSRTPLNVTQGDVSANIAAIEAGTWCPGVHDPTALQILACLDVGVPAEHMVRLIKRIRDGSATTNLVEQSHAIHNLLLKEHERMEEPLLRARGVISQSKTLVRPGREDKGVLALERQLRKNGNAQVQVFGFRTFSRLLSDGDVAAALEEPLRFPWSGQQTEAGKEAQPLSATP